MIRIGRKIDIEKFVGASRGVAIAPEKRSIVRTTQPTGDRTSNRSSFCSSPQKGCTIKSQTAAECGNCDRPGSNNRTRSSPNL